MKPGLCKLAAKWKSGKQPNLVLQAPDAKPDIPYFSQSPSNLDSSLPRIKSTKYMQPNLDMDGLEIYFQHFSYEKKFRVWVFFVALKVVNEMLI